MPKVGKNDYDYDAAGMARANADSQRTGNPVQIKPNSGPPQRPGNPIKGVIAQGGTRPDAGFKGGVRPLNTPNQNASAVNNFMNKNAMQGLDGPMQSPQNISRMQRGLNQLNSNNPSYTPLKPDGVYGPKTRQTAQNYFGGGQKRRSRRGRPQSSGRGKY